MFYSGDLFIMAALRSRCGHYIFALLFLSIFLFSSPNLSGRRLDVYHTSTHGVALVRIHDAQKSPFWHHRTTLSGCIFAAEACIDNRKNLLNIDTSSTCPHNMVNFGLLTAEICWRVWGTPANFNGFRVLAALLHGTLVAGGQPNFAVFNRGRHVYLAGRPSRWALAHIVVYLFIIFRALIFEAEECRPTGPLPGCRNVL